MSQLRRAAVSVPSNLAEGSKRSGKNIFANFVSIAHGSAAEVETQLEIAVMLNYIDREESQQALSLIDEVMRMLGKLLIVLKNTEN